MSTPQNPFEQPGGSAYGPDATVPPASPGGAQEPRVENVYVASETFTSGGPVPPQGQAFPQNPYAGLPYWQTHPPFAQTPSGQFVPVAHWSDKGKLASGLFGIFLGAFGVHNFYLGFTGKAIAQLLITVLSLGLLSWVSATWGLVEGILILSSQTGTKWDQDALGFPMLPIGVQN